MSYPGIDKYSSLNSPLHSFDPRAKVVTFTALIFSFAFIPELIIAIFAVLFSIAMIFISKIPPVFVFRYLRFPALFIFTIIVVMAFTVEGRPLLDLHYISITQEGIDIGSLIFFRAIAALILAFLMLATSRFDEIIKAMYMLKVPGVMVQIITFSYRYIFVILDELHTLKRSMYARGFNLKLNMYSLSVLGNMVGMLLIKSYDRGERVYRSMIARGYTGNPRLFTSFNMITKDYILSAVMLATAVSVQLIPLLT
ncbi:cobalt ABC transporter, inner membrane subunit CbiQ [Methanosalsum zhilinae DSM 4017]|uniref:Cobalt ABC transporter, inner membrane subunit CbiQ n=1 Tax=Methanosalsum zhilinae (strain DSM 4017 / NBRC 107636 / OCM 62 / WeN5) TaxID=679901 RepID=F7XKR0_METZD|nr:cobalt ECF transporter T component CbiQ [Methanosalsum zhilinae]AEH61773.1 cobalt ABC transporter, inner membrane subunit CbiQ [Methanosalsum zhilinae DSM 4017]